MSAYSIDLDQLAVALSDHSSEWVLDTRTGAIVMAEWVRDPELREDMGLEVGDEPDDSDPLDDDRFVGIEPVSSNEGFRWMEAFADAQDERVRQRLLHALNQSRPFRRFKDALLAFPEVRDAWGAYEDEKLREEARAWLRSHDIDAEIVEPRPAV